MRPKGTFPLGQPHQFRGTLLVSTQGVQHARTQHSQDCFYLGRPSGYGDCVGDTPQFIQSQTDHAIVDCAGVQLAGFANELPTDISGRALGFKLSQLFGSDEFSINVMAGFGAGAANPHQGDVRVPSGLESPVN
jgi:hypothetical protein